MRGSDGMQEALFTVAKLEDFVPSDHPQRGRVGVRACSGWIRSVFPASPCRAAARSGAFWRSWRRIFRSLYAIPDSIEINALSYADIRPGSSRIDRFLSVPTPNRQRRVSVAKGSSVGRR